MFTGIGPYYGDGMCGEAGHIEGPNNALTRDAGQLRTDVSQGLGVRIGTVTKRLSWAYQLLREA
jgi:hypothetical protein